MKFSVKTGPNYDDLKSAIEKISQCEAFFVFKYFFHFELPPKKHLIYLEVSPVWQGLLDTNFTIHSIYRLIFCVF